MINMPELKGLKINCDGAIANIIFDNPPLNLMDQMLIDSLDNLGRWLEREDALKVAIFSSANPDFFIAHADLKMLQAMPRSMQPKSSHPSPHQQIISRFETLPQVTIGKLEGIARGGGSEFLLSLDMRFGAIGRAVLGQPEVAFGFPPGCGATQRLPKLIGRSHALEAILGCADYSACDAERVGWLNRALPPEELGDFVCQLAERIASFPRTAIVAAKSVMPSDTRTLTEGLRDEFLAFSNTYSLPHAESRVNRALQQGFQTRAVESRPLDNWLATFAATADI